MSGFCLGLINKCKSAIQLYSPYIHAYRTTPNALTTTVKGITSGNTSHPPTKISRMGIINWLVQMTSQPTLLYPCPGVNPVPYNNPPYSQTVTKVCHTMDTTLFPFGNKLSDSNGRMRYLPLYPHCSLYLVPRIRRLVSTQYFI